MEGRLEGCTGFDLMVDWLVVEMVDRLVVVLIVSMDDHRIVHIIIIQRGRLCVVRECFDWGYI